MPWIRNTRQTCIRNLRNILTTFQQTNQIRDFFFGIMLMKANLLRSNVKMLEQQTSISGIFCCNEINFFQSIHHTDTHIVHIPNRSSHQIELPIRRLTFKTFLNLHAYSLKSNSSQNIHSASFSRR